MGNRKKNFPLSLPFSISSSSSSTDRLWERRGNWMPLLPMISIGLLLLLSIFCPRARFLHALECVRTRALSGLTGGQGTAAAASVSRSTLTCEHRGVYDVHSKKLLGKSEIWWINSRNCARNQSNIGDLIVAFERQKKWTDGSFKVGLKSYRYLTKVHETHQLWIVIV